MLSEYFSVNQFFPYELEPITPRRETPEAPAADTRIRQHPTWQRLESVIIRALWPFTEARLAVSHALDEVEPLSAAT